MKIKNKKRTNKNKLFNLEIWSCVFLYIYFIHKLYYFHQNIQPLIFCDTHKIIYQKKALFMLIKNMCCDFLVFSIEKVVTVKRYTYLYVIYNLILINTYKYFRNLINICPMKAKIFRNS